MLISFFSELADLFDICATELSGFQKQGAFSTGHELLHSATAHKTCLPGVPLIRTSQASQSERYLSLTTIATFFFAVTSSTLQVAFQSDPDTDNESLNSAVNTFFLLSLVFSPASAVQALLAMAWMETFVHVSLPELSSLSLSFRRSCSSLAASRRISWLFSGLPRAPYYP